MNTNLKISYINADILKSAEYNPRKWGDSATKKLKESINVKCAVGGGRTRTWYNINRFTNETNNNIFSTWQKRQVG